MDKEGIIKWFARVIVFIYFIINIDAWIQELAPVFFNEHISLALR